MPLDDYYLLKLEFMSKMNVLHKARTQNPDEFKKHLDNVIRIDSSLYKINREIILFHRFYDTSYTQIGQLATRMEGLCVIEIDSSRTREEEQEYCLEVLVKRYQELFSEMTGELEALIKLSEI